MATQKIYDLAVKVGSYRDSSGQEKNRYQNIGALMHGPDGRQFISLDRWFSPAGVPNPDNRSNVLVSMFESKGAAQERPSAPARPLVPDSPADDIPF